MHFNYYLVILTIRTTRGNEMNINPELIAPASHIHKGEQVRVFWSTAKGYNYKGQECVTVGIMSGEHKGKWTTAAVNELIKIGETKNDNAI